MGDTLIKTTARFQDTQEPIKQRPIIQIDKTALPNTIRASIESGRDNPFKPDGEIYKSADPIVDYYKYGPNQSRTHTPTDSQLLLNGSQNSQVEDGKKTKRKKKKKKDAAGGTAGRGEEESESKKSCWRKWLCCCCCCCKWKSRCCGKKTAADNEEVNVIDITSEQSSALPSTIEPITGSLTKEKQTKIVVLRDANDDLSSVNNSTEQSPLPPLSGLKNSRIEFISGSAVSNETDINKVNLGEEDKSQQQQQPQTASKQQQQIETSSKQTQEKSTKTSSNNKGKSKCVVS